MVPPLIKIRFWGKKLIGLRVTTDSDAAFREECIGEGFKIVTIENLVYL